MSEAFTENKFPKILLAISQIMVESATTSYRGQMSLISRVNGYQPR
jgi:hypothetical protein